MKQLISYLLCALLALSGPAYAGTKLSQITDGGIVAPSTDKMVAVRSGTTDVLVTPATISINSISTNTAAGSTAQTTYVYLVSNGSTLTLPTAIGNTNIYIVKRTGSSNVTLATTSSQTIDGSTTATLTVQYQTLVLVSNGSNWNII